ncbi:opioid growth factor receptor conserved region-domain-containing protein [Biscogniauxia marginata]|nr:opioid growth factor receptor conserved region-domain-containing protein [Biscogniauxia marginata]
MAGSPRASRPSEPSLRSLVNFYDPSVNGLDERHRTLDQILAWRDSRLEIQHDYIQILFPLPEGSVYSFMAPVIDEETFLYWRQHDELKENMRRALKRMLAFYGFEIKWEKSESGERLVEITEGADCEEKFARWVRRLNHNHLRITRIIRSLRVLGLEEEARAFYDALVWTYDAYGQIGASSIGFWQRAAIAPLHIAPDGDEVEWLEKYEVTQGSSDGI